MADSAISSRPMAFSGDAKREAVFIGLIVLSALVFWRPLQTSFGLAWHVDEYTHLLLILPVSLALIYLERASWLGKISASPLAGTVVFMTVVGLAIVSKIERPQLQPDVSLFISMLALVTFWMACVIGFYGVRVFKALMFPLLFLFFLAPVPQFALDAAIHALQVASTEATYDLFKLSGLPVLRTGFLLTFPTLQIEVARECSGIRSSIMLLMTGLILEHLFLKSLWRKAVFVLFIVPMSVIKNAIRIFVLSMLGMYVDMGFLHGRLHHEGGIVFFLIALSGMLLLLWLLQRGQDVTSSGASPSVASSAL